jgi:hypothetical protein
VKLAITAALAAATLLAIPSSFARGGTEFHVPDFSHLRARASETVDVNVGGFLLGLARWVTREERETDPHLKILEDIRSVKVRSYKFDNDGEYSREDVDSVRKQLSGPAWNPMVQIHKPKAQEDVDVYVCFENNKSCGLAVIATEPREFTVVSIVGNIDIDRLAQLEGEFGIPKLGDRADSNPEQDPEEK